MTRTRAELAWGIGPLAGAVAACAVVLLRPGLIGAVDVWPHLVRQQAVAETLRSGSSPFWTFLFYGGFPLLRFYGPLFALCSGALQLVVGDPVWTLKVLLFVLQALSGWAMLALLRRRVSLPAAGLGAAVYLLMPWRLVSLVTEANLPQALVYLFLPLLFLGLDWLGRADAPGGLRRGLALCGLSLGLLVLTHPFYALLAGAAAGAAAFLAGPGRKRRVFGLAGAIVPALLVAGFFVVPFLLEYRAHLYPVLPLGVPMPDLGVLLWPLSGGEGYRGFYFGLSVVLGALASGFLLVARGRRGETSLAAPFFATLGLAVLATWPAGWLGLVPTGMPPGRALVLAVFGCAGLAAFGVERLAARPGRALVLAGLALVLGADSLPFIGGIRYLAPERGLPVRLELYGLIPDRPSPRVLDVHEAVATVDDYPRLAVYPALGYLFGGFGSPFGPPFHQFAPRSMMYVYPWAGFAAADLGDPARHELSDATLKALALAGVSHVITPAARAGQGLVMTKPGIGWDDRFLRADRRPALVFGPTGAPLALGSRVLRPVAGAGAARARTMEYAGDWQELLAGLELDPESGTISTIPVRGAAYDSLPGTGAVSVREQQVRHDRVSVRLEAESDCWLRLAVSWYPYLDVRLDGEPVAFARTADGFVYLRCPAGSREVSVTAPLGRARRALLPVSVLALMGCVVMMLAPVRRRRRKRGAADGR